MNTALTKLKRATHRNKLYGKAPHKPVLLLAVIEQIESGNITDNRVYITAELVAAFQKIWLKLVPHEGWQPRFFLPPTHEAFALRLNQQTESAVSLFEI